MEWRFRRDGVSIVSDGCHACDGGRYHVGRVWQGVITFDTTTLETSYAWRTPHDDGAVASSPPAPLPPVIDPPGFARAVPEPATWAMLIAGFGLVGASLRGRRKAAMAAA